MHRHAPESESERNSRLIRRFRTARRHPTMTVLEGIHPLKHALRFGAEIIEIVTPNLDRLLGLSANLAPDLVTPLQARAMVIPADIFRQCSPAPQDAGVLTLARRNPALVTDLTDADRSAPLICLEQPTHLGNIGAAIRVAAGAGASGVITTGDQDPWHPTAMRGAAGLQYAVPVAWTDTLPPCRGPMLGIHPDGETLQPGAIPANAVLYFGSELRGISSDVLTNMDRCLSIPMEPGVSSLNLATSVAIVLYLWRLGR